MARIPLQVASRGLEIGSAVQYSGADPVGGALRNLGSTIGQVAELHQQRQSQDESFKANQEVQRFDPVYQESLVSVQQKAPVDGSGIHDNGLKVFDEKAAQTLKALPASQRTKYTEVMKTKRISESARLAGVQNERRYENFRAGIVQTTQKAIEQAVNYPDQFDAAVQTAIGAVDASGLDEAEKAPMREKIRATLGIAVTEQAKLSDPAALARSLGVAIPALPSDDTVVSPGNPSLPAGMRNNNPGNIKFVGRTRFSGVVGASQNTDQGDRQTVFETPEAGMRAAYELAHRKYEGGKTTANQLIAGEGGWTPGNKTAAANIARSMGIGPDDDLNLQDRNGAARFLRALVQQEHGQASGAYSDELIAAAVSGDVAPSKPGQPAASLRGQNLPIISRSGAPADVDGVQPLVIDRFTALQNQWGRALPVNSGHRDAGHNAAVGGAKGSQHISGNALDIDVSKMSTDERTQLIGMASAMGFTGIGVYNNAIHLDNGPRRSWGPSYHGDSVPSWAQGAVQAHLSGNSDAATRGPLAAPGVTLDPRFAGIPFTDRMKIAGDALTLAKSRADQQKVVATAAYKSNVDAYSLGILTNKIASEDDILSAGFKDDDTATLLRTFRTQQKEEGETGKALREYLSGTMRDLNPLDADERGRADKAYTALLKGAGPEPARELVQQMTSSFIRDTGIIPPKVQADLRAGMLSTNASTLAATAQMAVQVQSIAPMAFNNMPGADDLGRDLTTFRTLVDQRGYAATDAAKEVLERRRPEFQTSKKVWEAGAKEAAAELEPASITSTIATEFDIRTGPGGEPDAPIDPQTQNLLTSQYRDIYAEEFIEANGKADVAAANTLRIMKKTWGVSDISGERHLMQYAPEALYPPIGGSHAYIKDDALAAAKSVAGEGVEVENVYLVPYLDPQTGRNLTAEDTRAGRRPRYMVGYVHKVDGIDVYEVAPRTWAITDDGLKTRMDELKQSSIEAAEAARAEADAELQRIESFPARTAAGVGEAVGRVQDALGIGSAPSSGPAQAGKVGRYTRAPKLPDAAEVLPDPTSREGIAARLNERGQEMRRNAIR